MKKDTNNNIEVLARLMEQLYCTWDALPPSIAIIQDNTARECTNQKIVMWAVRLVAMGVFESIVLCYPQKGHTHGPLDGVFGQMCVKLSLAEFQDDMDVVNILDNFLKSSGLDTGSRKELKPISLTRALSGSSGQRQSTSHRQIYLVQRPRASFEYVSEDSLGIPGRMATWHQRFMHATWSTTGAIYLGQRMTSCL
jgi:hypothetical protein